MSEVTEIVDKVLNDFLKDNSINYNCKKEYYPKYYFKDNSIEDELKLIKYLYDNLIIDKTKYEHYSISFHFKYFEFNFYNQMSDFRFYYEKLFTYYINDYKSFNLFLNQFYQIINYNKEKINLWNFEAKYNKYNKDDKLLFGNYITSFFLNHKLFEEETFYKEYIQTENLINNFMLLEPNKDLFKKFDIIYNILNTELSKKQFLSFSNINCSKLLFNTINGIEIHICSTLDKIKDYISYIKEIKNLDKTIIIYFYVNEFNKDICELLNNNEFNVIFSDKNSNSVTKKNNEFWFLVNENNDIYNFLDCNLYILKENKINFSCLKFGFLHIHNGHLIKINENIYNMEFYKKIYNMKTFISFDDFNDDNIKKSFEILIKSKNCSLSFIIFKNENELLSNILKKYFDNFTINLNKDILYIGIYDYLFYLIENNYSSIIDIIYLKKDLKNQNKEKLSNYIKRDFYEFPCNKLYIVKNLYEEIPQFKDIIICKKRNYKRLLTTFCILNKKYHLLYKKTILINISQFLSQKLIIKIED